MDGLQEEDGTNDGRRSVLATALATAGHGAHYWKPEKLAKRMLAVGDQDALLQASPANTNTRLAMSVKIHVVDGIWPDLTHPTCRRINSKAKS